MATDQRGHAAPTGTADLAAVLDPIRELLAAQKELIRRSRTDYVPTSEWNVAADRLAARVPRLLAVVDAVLALADKLPPQGPASSALEEDRMWIRQECAEMIREAVSAALRGTEADDA